MSLRLLHSRGCLLFLMQIFTKVSKSKHLHAQLSSFLNLYFQFLRLTILIMQTQSLHQVVRRKDLIT